MNSCGSVQGVCWEGGLIRPPPFSGHAGRVITPHWSPSTGLTWRIQYQPRRLESMCEERVHERTDRNRASMPPMRRSSDRGKNIIPSSGPAGALMTKGGCRAEPAFASGPASPPGFVHCGRAGRKWTMATSCRPAKVKRIPALSSHVSHGLRRPAKSATSICSILEMVFILAMLSGAAFVQGSEMGLGSSGANLTPQNDRVMVFTDSWGTDYYVEFLSVILGREVLLLRNAIPGGTLVDSIALASSIAEPGHECGIVITNFGSRDVAQDLPWGEIEVNMREFFRLLKATGAIVVYNQIPPESKYPFGKICEEEGVIRVPEDYWVYDLCKGDPVAGFEGFSEVWGGSHPGPWGAAVMAERTARVMVDAGIIDLVEPCDLESFDFAGLCSTASQLIDEVKRLDSAAETVSANTEGMEDYLRMAEPIREAGAGFATRWLLRDWIIEPLNMTVERWDDVLELAGLWERDCGQKTMDWPVREWTPHKRIAEGFPPYPPTNLSQESMPYRLDFLMENWDRIQDMLAEATQCIETLKAEGNTRDAAIAAADLSRAKEYWCEGMQYDDTVAFLDKVSARCPEPAFLAVLSLALLPILLRGSRDWFPLE
jgi:hypothetical protein